MVLALALIAPPACTPGSAPAGEAVFENRCASCHTLASGAGSLPGPGLAGLLGRPVAGDPDFDYSPALRAARARGLTWDAARLDRFLADPDAAFPGNWMGSGNGLGDPAERAALVRFLAGPRP